MGTNRMIHLAISLIAIFLPINSSLLVLINQQLTNTSVLDVDGNPLQANTKYYITPPPRHGVGGGGGLALSIRDRRNDPCPPNVMQENDETSVGLSLKIFSSLENNKPSSSHDIIKVSTDVNIAFMAATTCVQRTVWKLGVPDGITGRRYVRSGGVLGRAGAETVGNWFKIEKTMTATSGKGYYYYYKIVYCPSVCRSCRVDCGEVGVFAEEGKKWLGLGGQPLLVGFKKVYDNLV